MPNRQNNTHHTESSNFHTSSWQTPSEEKLATICIGFNFLPLLLAQSCECLELFWRKFEEHNFL